MARLMLASGISGRYAELGAALLNRFDTSGSDFAQAVAIDPTQLGISSAASLSQPPSQIGLSIKTVSGIKVELALTQENGRLSVQVTSSGTLSDKERAALAKLADAFQTAMDGMTADKPKIAIAG